MAASVTLDPTTPAEAVTLGDVSFLAEQFSLTVQRPTVCHTLCSGAQQVTLLGEMPCTLKLGGRTVPTDGSELPARLQALLSADTAYSFSFRGAAFTGMQITELQCSAEQNRHDAAISVTLIGTLGGVSA